MLLLLCYLTIHLVTVLQCAGDGSHVPLYGPSPVLHVPHLLQAVVEAFNKLQPSSGLLGEVCGVQLELLSLGVEPLLIEISLGHSYVEVVHQGSGQVGSCTQGFFSLHLKIWLVYTFLLSLQNWD